LLNHAALRARDDAGMQHVPVVTVITDLGKVHESWLVPNADAVVVPAHEVTARALSRGVPTDRVHLLGHPIHPKFDDVAGSKAALRAQLGLPKETPVVMLMAGGEGGGKLLSTARTLAKARLPIELVVVCGRNEPLEQKLRELAPSLPTPMHVLGFTDKIPEYFRAADLLVTKAGPGTIAEANAAQLPIVVYDFVPGQERGNVDFVRRNDLGAVALGSASSVVAAVRSLIGHPERLAAIRRNQEAVAPVRSSRRIAALIKEMALRGSTVPNVAAAEYLGRARLLPKVKVATQIAQD
jgi:1,2-diacylglycerol 3-beta-galactosyltransferase